MHVRAALLHRIVFADLFHNPVAQEADYRLYVIAHVPTLCMLDRKGLHVNVTPNNVDNDLLCSSACDFIYANSNGKYCPRNYSTIKIDLANK